MKRFTTSIFLLFWLTAMSGIAQDKLPVISQEDMKTWQSLRYTSISDNGEWIAYSIGVLEGNDTLYLKSTDGEKVYEFALASGIQFSEDGQWAALRIGYSEKKLEQLQKQKKPVEYKALLLNLKTGKERIFDRIQQFSFTEKGNWLYMRKYGTKEAKHKGVDLLMLHLATNTLHNKGNVSEISINDGGSYMARIIDAAEKYGNAVEVMNLESGKVELIDADTCIYSGLSWEEDGKAFAFYKAFSDTLYEESNFYLYASRLEGNTFRTKMLNPVKINAIAEDMRIKDSRRLTFSGDLELLYFGVHDWNLKDTTSQKKKKDEKLPGLDIWHWKDDPIQPRQEKTYDQDKNFSHLYSWNLSTGKVVQLSDEEFRNVQILNEGNHVLIGSDKKYRPAFRMRPYDYYLVNARTGEKKLLKENYISGFRSSETGRYLLYFDEQNWWTYNVENGKTANLTEGLDVPFWNVRDDSPKEIKPPFYGANRWYENDEAVLLYDEYDVWKVKADGSSKERLTNGRGEEIIYRYYMVNRDEDFIGPESTVIFTKTGDKTKKSGYAQLAKNGKVKELIYEDRSISSITKAEDADAFIFIKQKYDESPNVFFTDRKFRKPVQMSETNPQQKNFAWGHSELINYKNADGKELQGALFYPANFEKGKQYPMLVYIYEIRSNQLHRYVTPSPRSSYNTTNYTQEGFFVFQPDIVYKTNHPGESAVDCVVPAVEEVLKTGMVDKDRIGLMGHSWGAYQTAFIITQTDLFSAAVAGAPLTNMISMYNSIYWNSGSPDQNIFETSQGRLREPWWNIMQEYMDNSPMFEAMNIKTPLLVAFGNQDGAVDWHQGIEMYTTMRRMEKPYIMLVYDGENHGLRKKENQLDYTLKINQFFKHFLLEEKAEDWIIEGKTYLKKKQEEAKQK